MEIETCNKVAKDLRDPYSRGSRRLQSELFCERTCDAPNFETSNRRTSYGTARRFLCLFVLFFTFNARNHSRFALKSKHDLNPDNWPLQPKLPIVEI